MTVKIPGNGWMYCGWFVLLLLAGCSPGGTREQGRRCPA